MCVYPVCARIFGCVFSAEIEVHTERTPPPPSAFRHVRASSVRTPRAVPDVLNYFNLSARANASERIVPESTVKMCVCVDRSNRERWRRICLRKRARARARSRCAGFVCKTGRIDFSQNIFVCLQATAATRCTSQTPTHIYTHTRARDRANMFIYKP